MYGRPCGSEHGGVHRFGVRVRLQAVSHGLNAHLISGTECTARRRWRSLGVSGMKDGDIRIGRRLRVLVADDNRDSADTLAMLLRMSGHETRTANDGERALLIAFSGWPDIAVLDIEMPLLSGYEVARAIRATSNAARVALVALTGWTREIERAKARVAGFDTFLTKPVEFTELDAVLRQLEVPGRG